MMRYTALAGASLVPLVLVACGGSSDVGIAPNDSGAVDANDALDASGEVDGAGSVGADAGDATINGGDASDGASPSDASDGAPPSDASDGASPSDASDGGAPVDATLPDAGPPVLCIPGESIECVGPGGCISNQVCLADGSGYGACGCATDASQGMACVPGQSIACAGVGGCSGYQVCNGVGSGYEPCQCVDAGSENGGGDSGVTGWTPADLPGLALWFDDTYGLVQDPTHPGYLIHWRDKSGNGNDATMNPNYNQGGGIALDPQTINGLDAVVCSSLGASISVFDAPSIEWGMGDFAIIVVGSGLTSPRDNFGNPTASFWNQPGLTLQLFSQFTLFVADTSIAETPSTTERFNLLEARGQSSLFISFNGQTATGTATPQNAGGAISLCPGINGELAEVIAVKGTLSDADLANVTTYLTTKFNLH